MQIETNSFAPSDSAAETKSALEELMRAFESFKESNDARLEEIEKNHSADILLEDKVSRINDDLTRLGTLVQRPALDREETVQSDMIEQRTAFQHFLRTGEAAQMQILESKDFSSTNSEGGYLLPDIVMYDLQSKLTKLSALRQLATVKEITYGHEFNYISNEKNVTASWGTEKSSRAAGTTPNFTKQTIALFELYSLQAATTAFLQDVNIDIETWLVDNMLHAFADAENNKFIHGGGNSDPAGLFSPSITTNENAATDRVRSVHTGSSTTLNPARLHEKIIALIYGLGSSYRANAVFLMNPSVQGEFRKAKDSDGNYLWMPTQGQGLPASLMGFPVHEEGHMPDVGINAMVAAFGDFQRAMLIIDKPHTSLLRDPYTRQPYVQFLLSRRVGSGIVDKLAYRLLKVSV